MARARSLADLSAEELRGRRVLARVDYNVPLTEAGEIADPVRVNATLPTLALLREAGARTLLVSHMGRPKGKPDPAASLAPVARLLSEKLSVSVPLLEAPPGSAELATAVEAIQPGGFALLENSRFLPGETKNDPALAEALAGLADVFVGDAFGVVHRMHASNVGSARLIRERGGPAVAGLLMAKELRYLGEVLFDPTRPFVAILGGAKISGKIDLIRAILPRVDRLLIGGAMANTFFRALGLETGSSLVEDDRVPMASELLEEAGEKLILPVDCVVADRLDAGAEARVVDRTAVGPLECIGDIGPDSAELFAREIREAATVLWNGPMGVFEIPPFQEGTFAVARELAQRADAGAIIVVGGGDSAAAAQSAGVSDRMTHISTGGGASLDLLAGRELPGVSVLESGPGAPGAPIEGERLA
ncbi:MAG: phosphoglycerate kinase [Gemmatimonadota bacterium]